MNPVQILTSLSAEDRINMTMMGLRPLNPNDVKRYKQGQGISITEKMERAKTLFGSSSGGFAGEKEMDASRLVETPMEEVQQRISKPTDFKELLKEEMDNYSPRGKTFSTDDLISLKKINEPQAEKRPQSLEQIKLEGFNNAKQYLNSFILNLQSPTQKNRLNLFKQLKNCLEGEVKYKNSPNALNAYTNGEMQAEAAMLKKLST